jgi:hypothetical protein
MVRAFHAKIFRVGGGHGAKPRRETVQGHAETSETASETAVKVEKAEMKARRRRDGNPVWLRFLGVLGCVFVIIRHFFGNRNYM